MSRMKNVKRILGHCMAVCSVLVLLCGCSRRIYVPVERVTHDTTYLSKTQRDSVHVHDSVLVWMHGEGDTVYLERVVTRYEYRLKLLQDTVLAVRSDTVSVPVETVRPLGWWERTRIRLFVPLVALCVMLCVAVWWMVRRR